MINNPFYRKNSDSNMRLYLVKCYFIGAVEAAIVRASSKEDAIKLADFENSNIEVTELLNNGPEERIAFFYEGNS